MAIDRMRISDQALGMVAARFRCLGEPMRLRILRLLEKQEMSVGQLVERLESSQANVSKHLKVMVGAGVLARRTRGTSALYSICDPVILKICDTVCSSLAENLRAQVEGFGFRLAQPKK